MSDSEKNEKDSEVNAEAEIEQQEKKITKEMILNELEQRDEENVKEAWGKVFANIIGKHVADDEDVEVKVVEQKEKDLDELEDEQSGVAQDEDTEDEQNSEKSSQNSETVSFKCEAEVEADMFEE